MMKIVYEGNLRTRSVHESGASILTDAPKDNLGKGENFSPTDLLAISLGSCVLTLMGIAAQRLALDFSGATIDLEKEMSVAPVRRIGLISLKVHSDLSPKLEDKLKLEAAAHSCPVKMSLHPDIQLEITFFWGKI